MSPIMLHYMPAVVCHVMTAAMSSMLLTYQWCTAVSGL